MNDSRPCGGCNRGAPFNGPYDISRQCRQCWLFANDSGYRQLWGGEPFPDGQKQFNAIAEQARNEQAQAQQGMVQQAVSFATAMAKWLAAGRPVTPPEELEKRKQACRACPHRLPLEGEPERCGKCGCAFQSVAILAGMLETPGKWDMATEECPLPEPDKRWRALVG